MPDEPSPRARTFGSAGPIAPMPRSGDALLELHGLGVSRGGRPVLDGVDLTVGRGEIFGLLGPNGAGKTSLFLALCGLVEPSAGTFRFDGVALDPGDRAFRARCGVVFQEPALDARLSARENLVLAGRLYGVGRREARGRAVELLERAGLADRADDRVGRLSGGQRRRVELARALVHRPDVLVLDEPTTGLDEGAYRRTWQGLEELRRDAGLTVLLTTHRGDEAERCDRLAILDGGRVVACDTPERLRARVRGDLIVLEAAEPDEAARCLATVLGLRARVVDGRLVLRQDEAHAWVPRLVEALPPGLLRSIAVRRTGMAEVFLELTGHELTDDERAREPGP